MAGPTDGKTDGRDAHLRLMIAVRRVMPEKQTPPQRRVRLQVILSEVVTLHLGSPGAVPPPWIALGPGSEELKPGCFELATAPFCQTTNPSHQGSTNPIDQPTSGREEGDPTTDGVWAAHKLSRDPHRIEVNVELSHNCEQTTEDLRHLFTLGSSSRHISASVILRHCSE